MSKLEHWSIDKFEEGRINQNRFFVYFPDHPRAHSGFILRSIVAYEAYHNISIPKGKLIHHKNLNKLDDSIENLQMLSYEEHFRFHNELKGKILITECLYCGQSFEIRRWKINANLGKFCSRKCKYDYQKTPVYKEYISNIVKNCGRIYLRKYQNEYFISNLKQLILESDRQFSINELSNTLGSYWAETRILLLDLKNQGIIESVGVGRNLRWKRRN